MKAITFSLDTKAVQCGVRHHDQVGARNHLAALKQRSMSTCGCATTSPTPPPTWNIVPMQHISFPGISNAYSVAAAAVAAVATIPNAFSRNVAADTEMVDQYAVGDCDAPKHGISRFFELLHGVAISNDVSSRKGRTSTLLGAFGHYERLSFWTHIGGAVLFVAYAIARHAVATNQDSVEGSLTTASGWTIACVFLTSSIYHSTAPDAHFSMVTRVLDYIAIYIGITVSTTADIAVATRGFKNVPVETILDLPASAAILICFFIWRRWMLPLEETWGDHQHSVSKKEGCSLGLGLFSRGHQDLQHMHARQATSLLIFANFFMSVPTAFALLGSQVAAVVLTLQIMGFVLVTFGMAIDRVLEFPDGLLLEESGTCFACPQSCGAVLNSHAVWHIVAVLSAMCTVASREFALYYY